MASFSILVPSQEYLIKPMALHVYVLIIVCSYYIPLGWRHVTDLRTYTSFNKYVDILISSGKLWLHSRSSFTNVRVFWTLFGRYYFFKSFAIFFNDYIDLYPVNLIAKNIFISVGITTHHRYMFLNDLGFFLFMIKGWHQSFLESIIYELSNLVNNILCLLLF